MQVSNQKFRQAVENAVLLVTALLFISHIAFASDCQNVDFSSEFPNFEGKGLSFALTQAQWRLSRSQIETSLSSLCEYKWSDLIDADTESDASDLTASVRKNSTAYDKCKEAIRYTSLFASAVACEHQGSWIEFNPSVPDFGALIRHFQSNRLTSIRRSLENRGVGAANLLPCYDFCMEGISRPWFALTRGTGIVFDKSNNLCSGLPNGKNCFSGQSSIVQKARTAQATPNANRRRTRPQRDTARANSNSNNSSPRRSQNEPNGPTPTDEEPSTSSSSELARGGSEDRIGAGVNDEAARSSPKPMVRDYNNNGNEDENGDKDKSSIASQSQRQSAKNAQKPTVGKSSASSGRGAICGGYIGLFVLVVVIFLFT